MFYLSIKYFTFLPQNFSLKEGQIYATTKPDLPERVIREAIVNAVMHRSYHHNRPTQIIRYNNRIEIINSGYSLKAQDEIGTAGSDTRNQLIASIFHETNLAEFKGTGIRTMRRLMSEAGLSMPTFESNRKGDTFTIRLLLHKFFSEEDNKWLDMVGTSGLSEIQKSALIFAREVGAVDTLTYFQLTGEKTELAEKNLEALEKAGFLLRKGKTLEATYYVLNRDFFAKAENEMSLNVPKNLEIMSLNVPKDSLTERQKEIIRIIHEKNSITVKEIAEKLSVTEKTVKRDITNLKEKHIIERIGGKNGGHWEIVKSKLR